MKNKAGISNHGNIGTLLAVLRDYRKVVSGLPCVQIGGHVHIMYRGYSKNNVATGEKQNGSVLAIMASLQEYQSEVSVLSELWLS